MISELRISADHVYACTGKTAAFKKGGRRYARNAFTVGEEIVIRITIPRQIGADAVSVSFLADAGGKTYEREAIFCMIERENDIYECTVPDFSAGLYFYRIDILSVAGKCSGRRVGYENKMGFFPSGEDNPYTFQLLFCEKDSHTPKWLYGGVIYHIFVDRFYRGRETPVSPGAEMNPDWENGIPQYPAYPGAPLKNNMFFGGNLDGIRKKLPYIASLGVSCLYLSPIFKAASNHKYDTGDYMTIDEMFGNEEDLSALIRDAEQHGIRIILDGVFNHTGDDSLYFNRYGHYPSVGAYQSKESPYYSWYDFRSFPDSYASWWDIDILPRIQPDRPECRTYFVGENGVIPKWMRFGIAGFRLDVADELSDDFIAAIKKAVRSVRKDAVLYGEVWEDASVKIAYGKRRAYYYGKELDGVMNYPIRTGLIAYFRNGETEDLRYALTDIIANAPKQIADLQMNLLGTHDTERILTALGGDARGDTPNDVLALKRMTAGQRSYAVRALTAAYLVLATVPGVPAVFYGDEAGLEGYGDPFNRRPYPWHKQDQTLLSAYKQIGAMRRRYRVYRDGEFRLLTLTSERLVFARDAENGKSFLTVINRKGTALKLHLPEKSRVLYGGKRNRDELVLSPLGGAVIALNAGDAVAFSDDTP